MKRLVAAVAALLALNITTAVAAPSSGAASSASAAAGPRVTTFAGDGLPGLRDGAAAQAEFMGPSAMAFGPDGALYVVDQAAQRIRKIQNGVVTTIAGSGAPSSFGLAVAGGYRDGPALQAQFNEPDGIAVAKDGTIYVADMMNHAIRRIKNGIVSTFAGSPARDRFTDGPLAEAAFHRPHGLAIDDQGNIYVADLYVGIRKIATDGTVARLPMSPGVGNNSYTGIAIAGSGKDQILAAVETEFVHILRDGKDTPFGQKEEGAQAFPHPYGVAVLDDLHFVFTDVFENVVRLCRVPDKPYVGGEFSQAIAGTAREDWAAGGFRDGPVADARFAVPRAVVVRNGTIYVADEGNRRIRAFPLPDWRGPIGTHIEKLSQDPAHYRIAYVYGSHAFYLVDFPHSLGGILEQGLGADAARLGIPRPPRATVTRIDGAGIQQLTDYVKTYLSDGQADLVVMGMHTEIRQDQRSWAEEVKKLLLDTQHSVEAGGGKFVVMIVPQQNVMPGYENVFERESALPESGVPPSLSEQTWIDLERGTIDAVKQTGIPYYAALDDFLNFERRLDHVPLFGMNDFHITPTATRILGEGVLRRIEEARPWAPARPASR